jgi:hypothetical protein
MAAAKKTTDHREIQRWVEQHGGRPATVARTRSKRDVGMIRIDFPGYSGERSLAPITWDEWFQKFDQQELAFLYQEGKRTNFNKLVRREPDEVRPSDRRRGPSRTTRGGRAAAHALAVERGRRAGAGKPAARTRRGDIHDWSKAQLMQRARDLGLANRSSMNKAQLVRALEKRER